MDSPSSIRTPYYVATFPFLVSIGQVLLASAPLSTLWVGAGMSVLVALLLWAGTAWLRRARPRFGKAVALRLWQAPVLWVPVVLAVVVVLFLGFTR